MKKKEYIAVTLLPEHKETLRQLACQSGERTPPEFAIQVVADNYYPDSWSCVNHACKRRVHKLNFTGKETEPIELTLAPGE